MEDNCGTCWPKFTITVKKVRNMERLKPWGRGIILYFKYRKQTFCYLWKPKVINHLVPHDINDTRLSLCAYVEQNLYS